MMLAVHKAESDNRPDEQLLINNTSVTAIGASVKIFLVAPAAAYREILLNRVGK